MGWDNKVSQIDMNILNRLASITNSIDNGNVIIMLVLL